MGNRFPQCRRALRAGRAVRACVLAWEGGGTPPPRHPAPPRRLPQLCSSMKHPFNAAPEGLGPRAAALSARRGLKLMGKAEQGGGEQMLFGEHDVLLNACDIHAYECTLVMAAFEKCK